LNLPSLEHVEWWHAALGIIISALGGAAARGPAIARAMRRTIEEMLGKELTAHVQILRQNEAVREKADAQRTGGMIALSNLFNDGMGRVEALRGQVENFAARAEASEKAAAKVIKDFNGLGARVSAVERKQERADERLAGLESRVSTWAGPTGGEK
jgi:hypothetical protein